MAHHSSPGPPSDITANSFFGVFRYSRRAMELVWTTNTRLTVALAGFLAANSFKLLE